jgi:hypothetical protein
LTAARVLAGLVVQPLCEPARAARLTLATGGDALTLDAMITRLISATWGAPADAAPRYAMLRRVSQRIVLDALLDLAARQEAAPEVRASVHAHLAHLRAQLKLRRATDPSAEAHLRLAERDLTEFLTEPEVRRHRPPRVPAPPGRPIGESGD